jgi:hypothetical protein
MKAYVFFSIHEETFHRIAERLAHDGVSAFAGFVWGEQQARMLRGRGIDYDPLVVFTRDLLPSCDDGATPDVAWLQRRERELGVSIQRMFASERHLLAHRDATALLRLAEVALREVAAAYDRIRPDFVFSEDVSCFFSYVHFVLARERNIPFWSISSGRLPRRVSVASHGFQRSERVEAIYRDIVAHGFRGKERIEAETYVRTFRERPVRPTGMSARAAQPGIGVADLSRVIEIAKRYFGDRDDPTVTPPLTALAQRVRRIVRTYAADASLFEARVAGEPYVLYPIHFQPEASTLVQAPLYLDQLALLHDIARSLPIGYRLYVKEHVSNRGRRPLEFYRAIRRIPMVRLLGPDEDTWSLIDGATAIAVITGTMGWEGLLFGKSVITFGDVWFDILPQVFRARDVAKDRWFELFQRALTTPSFDPTPLLALVAAMHRGTYPGFFGNARVFPDVLDDDNIALLASALAQEAGLQAPRTTALPSTSA